MKKKNLNKIPYIEISMGKPSIDVLTLVLVLTGIILLSVNNDFGWILIILAIIYELLQRGK